MKNINQVLKSNLEEFDEWYEANTGFESKPRLERIKQFLTQSQQNLISAFKEMVENTDCISMYKEHWVSKDVLLSSLTEETPS